MTITEDHQTTAAEFVYDPCPAWCIVQHEGDHAYHHQEHKSSTLIR